jgi:AcrR family transcriptional regulator
VAYQRTPYVESKRAQARERLVEAALELLKAGGWREVQMSAVAAAAGISTGAIYLHFPSKTQLMSEMYRTQAAAELRILSGIAEQEAPAAQRLEAAIRAYAQRALANRRLGYAMMLEPTEIEVEEERLHAHVQYMAVFRGMVEAGAGRGGMHARRGHRVADRPVRRRAARAARAGPARRDEAARRQRGRVLPAGPRPDAGETDAATAR